MKALRVAYINHNDQDIRLRLELHKTNDIRDDYQYGWFVPSNNYWIDSTFSATFEGAINNLYALYDYPNSDWGLSYGHIDRYPISRLSK